ncbi:MAG: segregation/condensation protein A [Clostridia bacterium]|nr:segregation/condensation protein A [Clostridia bacterium]
MLKRESLKSETDAAREIPRDRFTVPEKINYIRETVREKERVQFEELFEDSASKAEIVTTFQALLELLKHQVLIVSQEEIFSSITIMKNPNRSEDEEIGEIDEYN